MTLLLHGDQDGADSPFAEDAERLAALSQEVISELREYGRRLIAGEVSGDGACIWLDQQTKRCVNATNHGHLSAVSLNLAHQDVASGEICTESIDLLSHGKNRLTT